MRDYDQIKLRENSDSYNRAWEDLRQTQKALVSFWLIGNGTGAALSLNFLIQMATTPKTTLPVYALFPSGLFLLGLLFAWILLVELVKAYQKRFMEWDGLVRGEQTNPLVMPPLLMIGRRYTYSTLSGACLFIGALLGVLAIVSLIDVESNSLRSLFSQACEWSRI